MRDREREVRAAYGACDLRISPSRFLRSMYLQHTDFDPHAFLYSDNGMRTDHVQALETERSASDPVRFGFVGSLVWYKGGESMVRAMGLLEDQNAELHVFGTFDPEQDDHHRELERLAQGAAVTFHGRFDNSRLAEVYAQIDVLIVPSVWFENSPITIHEAHLLNTPVIASNIGGMAEYVRDGIDGLHFEVGDPADLARGHGTFPGRTWALRRAFPGLSQSEGPWMKTWPKRNSAIGPWPAWSVRCPQVGSPWFGAEWNTPIRGGKVDRQGADLALLRPGAWVEYPIPAGQSGELCLELLYLAEEPDLEQAGRILLGDQPVLSLLPLRGSGLREVRLNLCFAAEIATLRVDTLHWNGGPAAHLRIEKVTWQPIK